MNINKIFNTITFVCLGRKALSEAELIVGANVSRQYAALGSLKKEGDLSAAGDLLASFEERQRSVAKHEWDALEARYRLPG